MSTDDTSADPMLSNPMDTVQASVAMTSRLQRHVMENALEALQLNLTQAIVVGYIAHRALAGHHHLNQTELAEQLRLGKPALGSAIDVLVARNAVERRPSESDRRAFMVDVTEEGIALAAKVDEQMLEVSSRIIEGLEPAAIETLLQALATMRENMSTMLGRAPLR